MKETAKPVVPQEHYWQSAVTLGALYRRHALSTVEVTRACLDRIGQANSLLNAFLHVCVDSALAEAKQAEREIRAGNYRGPLHGIPVAYKDVFHVRGLPTTAHSRVMAGYVAQVDSAVASRLRKAGAITLGKLNTTEFASGGMEVWEPARNPWCTDRSPGNSSSGAGAAVAAGLVPLAIASDTGGSVRIPAAFCGVFGLQPTLGRISRTGMLPVSSEMDCVGLVARTAADIGALLQVSAGPDQTDSAAIDVPVPDYVAGLPSDLLGLRLGVPRTYFFDHVDAEVQGAVRAAIDVLSSLGATIQPVDLQYAEYAYAAHWCITYSETFPRWRDLFYTRRNDFGNVYLRKITSWAFLTAEELVTGWRLRDAVRKDLLSALSQVDALITPTTPMVAPGLHDFVTTHQDTSRFNRISNVAGVPAMAVPCGFTADHLPISLQLIGSAWREDVLIGIAHAYEQVTASMRQARPTLQPGPNVEVWTPNPAVTPTTPRGDTPSPDAHWVRAYADLLGLRFLGEDDFGPIAAQIEPIKRQLAKARALRVA